LRGDRRSSTSFWFYATALGVVTADQITKALARGLLDDRGPVTVIPGLFDLRLDYNTGAAFGIMPNWAPLFIIVALVAVFVIVRMRRASGALLGLSVGLGLLLGGALGNLIDRLLLPVHAVTDFLSFHVRFRGEIYTWPTFNLADAAIVVGAAIVLFTVYAVEKRREQSSE
jgi:signal peptidase II